jgi:serine/threonine-protein kinase
MEGKDFLPDGWVLPGYEHVQLLGSGAGGHVWLAVHQGTGTLVAVKYLMPGLCASAGFRESYRAEAELLAALDSPHVTRLYEYVEGPPGAAIVMEAVEGSSLRELMKREHAAGSAEAALCILKGSLLGLAAAHESGVVHRDYKPANVLVTPRGASKLVDFGIAARTGEAAAAAGTPLYMAPEQFHGAPASPSADVYAATATFFECVTGERPFPGANAVELMAQHALGTIPDHLVPEPLRPLIRHGMAKDPFERPASARDFLAELEAVAGGAYGEDWERRGRDGLATLLALLPLLLLAGVQGAAQAGAVAAATTVLGDGGAAALGPVRQTPQSGGGGSGSGSGGGGGGGGGPGHPPGAVHAGGGGHDVHEFPHRRHHHKHDEQNEHHEDHRHDDGHEGGSGGRKIRPRRRRVSRWAVGGGGALIVAAAAVMAAAAYGTAQDVRTGASGGGSGTEIGALTGATTLVTLGRSPSPSPSPSLSPSTSTTGATASSTSAAGRVSATATIPSAAASRSASPSPSASPQIISMSFGTVQCANGVPTVTANVDVTSNGGAGTVVFSWYVIEPTGAPDPAFTTTTVSVPAGETSQVVTSTQSFASESTRDTWGVSVASTPVAGTTPRPYTFDPATAGCEPVVIQ